MTQHYIYVSSVGMKSAERFSVNPIVVHIELVGTERLDMKPLLTQCSRAV